MQVPQSRSRLSNGTDQDCSCQLAWRARDILEFWGRQSARTRLHSRSGAHHAGGAVQGLAADDPPLFLEPCIGSSEQRISVR